MTLGLEEAKILTLSTAHLHPGTISMIEQSRGDLSEGPSIAIRDEGYLVNSHLGVPDATDLDTRPGLFPSLNDRFPDLALIRALARGQVAEWINFDQDGVEYADLLPIYDGTQEVELPRHPFWSGAMMRKIMTTSGVDIIQASPETLDMISQPEHFLEIDESPSPI